MLKIVLKTVMILTTAVFLASCASTPTINLITSADMGMEMELNQSAPKVGYAAFSPDGRYILSSSEGNILRLWDIKTGRMARQVKGKMALLGGGGVNAATFSPDGRYIVSYDNSDDFRLKLYDVDTGILIRTFHSEILLTGLHTKYDHLLDRTYVAFSNDGRHVLDSDCRLWDVSTGDLVKRFRHGWCPGVALSPDGKYAALPKPAGVFGGLAEFGLFDVSTGEEIKTFNCSPYCITSAFSPDGRYVILGHLNGAITLWDISTGKELRTFEGHGGSGGVFSIAFSPDGKYVLSGGAEATFKLWDIETGKLIRVFTGHAGGGFGSGAQGVGFNQVNTVAFSMQGKYALSASQDASTRIWDSSTGQEIAMFVGFQDGEWLVITSEGYYNASENGAKYLSVKVGDKSYRIDTFYDVFYRPDIVAAKLRGDDIRDLITITMRDAIKSPPPVVEISPISAEAALPKAKVCYHIKSTGGGIGEVRLFHNGKLIESDGYYKEAAKTVTEKPKLARLDSKAIYEDMRSVKIKGRAEISPITTKTKGEAFNDCKEVDAISGENEISVAAFNGDNTVQSYMQTVKFTSTIKQEAPHLYILSIGIDQYRDNSVNLKYAVKDSKDIEEKILKQTETLYKPQNIHYELLTDNKATKANITGKINELSNLIKPIDSFIFFVAGHGVLLQNQYHVLTHDFDGAISENSMISSNEIVEMSKKIKSLSQLFIFDTCHAGGVDYIVSGLYDARMSVLAKKMGLHIYASASSIQEAKDGYEGNGLFTHALLDGLNNKKEADKNEDKRVSLVELGEYSKQMTGEIAKKIGHSQTPFIMNFGKDNAVYQLR